MLFYATLQQPTHGNNMREFEDFSHFFSIIEENFEEFGNVFGKKSKFYDKNQSFMLFYAFSLFSKNFMMFYDFMPSGTPALILGSN